MRPLTLLLAVSLILSCSTPGPVDPLNAVIETSIDSFAEECGNHEDLKLMTIQQFLHCDDDECVVIQLTLVCVDGQIDSDIQGGALTPMTSSEKEKKEISI